MQSIETSISGLYYRYNSISDEEIRNYLEDIKFVILKNNIYYPLSDESMAKIIDKPRRIGLCFETLTTSVDPIDNLKIYKTIKYLVKSPSRFFIKPDVGEIFDQIDRIDLHLIRPKIKAIEFITPHSSDLLPDTNGEHFVLEVNLLMERKTNDVTDIDEPYCSDCGEDEKIKYLDQYANGDYYCCGVCGKNFFHNRNNEE